MEQTKIQDKGSLEIHVWKVLNPDEEAWIGRNILHKCSSLYLPSGLHWLHSDSCWQSMKHDGWSSMTGVWRLYQWHSAEDLIQSDMARITLAFKVKPRIKSPVKLHWRDLDGERNRWCQNHESAHLPNGRKTANYDAKQRSSVSKRLVWKTVTVIIVIIINILFSTCQHKVCRLKNCEIRGKLQ